MDTPADIQKEVDTLRETKATWQTDGRGIRGIPVLISNTKANLNWESEVIFRRPVVDQTA
jgi:hypothetical protein